MRPISNDDSERVSMSSSKLRRRQGPTFFGFWIFATSIGYIIPLFGENASDKFLSKKLFEGYGRNIIYGIIMQQR
jgi:hypothetical protein